MQTLNPHDAKQRLKDTWDVKALVMHSVSGDVRMFPWLGEREPGSDNTEITQVRRAGEWEQGIVRSLS